LSASRSARLAALAAGVLVACASAPSRLEYASLESAAMGRPMDYALYLPPDWQPGEEMPLVVFLHGGGDGVDCFDEAGVGQVLDAALASGRLPRAAIVVAEGDLGFWENWADGSHAYRDWVLHDLVPHVEAATGAGPCPERCHVVGISMGGYGALRIALLEPRAFSTVTAISAPILDTDAMDDLANRSWLRFLIPVDRIWGDAQDREAIARGDLYLRWRGPADLGPTRLVLAWGDHDRRGVREMNERFHTHLEEAEIPHVALVFEGGHRWSDWTPVLVDALRIQLAPPESRTTSAEGVLTARPDTRRSTAPASDP